MRALLLLTFSMALGCSKATAPIAVVPSESSGAALSAKVPVPQAPAPKACHAEPALGVVVPVAARSQDLRVAAAGNQVLVTWLGPAQAEGGGRVARGRLFDGTLKPELNLDESEYGDVILSGTVPLASDANTLVTAGCVNSAPSGILYCSRQASDAKKTIFAEINFVNGGPQNPGIAGLARGNDTLLFLPSADGQIFAVSSRLPQKRRRSFFPLGNVPTVDSLTASFVGDAGAAAIVAYRRDTAIEVRRSNGEEALEKPIVVSEKGKKVGAPAILRRGNVLAIVYATQRAANAPSFGSSVPLTSFGRTEPPWQIERATLDGDTVTRAPLDLGSSDVTGITFGATDGNCVRTSWVTGSGKASVTKVGDLCGDARTPERVVDLSTAGVEAGRAWLAGSTGSEFAVWQEFPAGKQEYRVAKLVCDR